MERMATGQFPDQAFLTNYKEITISIVFSSLYLMVNSKLQYLYIIDNPTVPRS